MGRMSNDMRRLHEEIMNSHHDRQELMKNMQKFNNDTKSDVTEMLDGFHKANNEMGMKTKEMLKKSMMDRRAFLNHMKHTVKGMRKEIIADLNGAHQAWNGGSAH